jgi:hypothetical protein
MNEPKTIGKILAGERTQFNETVGDFRERIAGIMKPAHVPYQPKTGQQCTCRIGAARDNCRLCEGTGQVIDFAKVRAKQPHVTIGGGRPIRPHLGRGERPTIWKLYECGGGCRWSSTLDDCDGKICDYSGCGCGTKVYMIDVTTSRDVAANWFRGVQS